MKESLENKSIFNKALLKIKQCFDINSQNDTSLKPAPFLSYVTFNRLGLTERNLSKILDSDEEFEMHIIDCNSKDSSWKYIQSLNDSRIKSKTQLSQNVGPIFASNMNLAKRKPNQYFFAIDSDVYIKTDKWISKFMTIFEAFPDLGVLGVMRDNPYPRYMPPVIQQVKGNLSYLQLKNAELNAEMDFIPGHLQCLRPELIDTIGYWSEENGYGDAELSPRVVHYTPFNVGFITDVEIDMSQQINCTECKAQQWCDFNKSDTTCFSQIQKHNTNYSFAQTFHWKYMATFKELSEGKRTAYCASIHDPESIENHYYNEWWASENFDHYLKNANT